MLHHDAVRKLNLKPRATNSGKSADPILHRGSPFFNKIIAIARAILKMKEVLAYLSLDLNLSFKVIISKIVFVRMSL
jgi:hypothetical protein